ncbi:MAG: c-type cytochrome [Gammaproteobacteria bacterium]
MRRVYSILLLLAFVTLAVTAVAAEQEASARSGAAVFEAHCANCHTGGIGGFFTGAPKIGKKKDWESLTPKGVDELTATTIAGIGKMPARAECATCTDAEIYAAVEYILQESQ